jgi:5-methyltetrahydropteroyltriglutamate--homocysteine methyltransferase
MLKTTRDLTLPTAITGSYPRPLWFDASLGGRSFKAALGDSLFREQYLDAVAAIINAQEAAGLDIVTDGDSRFDLAVGGKSWFFYPIERLGGIHGHRSTSQGWMARHDIRPGKILWEVQEAYQPAIVNEKLTRGPLEYAALWQIAQRLSDRPVKFGTICAPGLASMLWNEHYADDKQMVLDLCDIMNAELRELAAAGCPVIQVEEPRHHGLTTRPDCTDSDLAFQTEAFNRQLAGVDAEIWVHTCWGNPNSASIGRCRAMSAPCPICCSSIATSSPSNAPATAARICRSSPNTRPARRSASASSTTATPSSSRPSTSPA